MSEHGASGHSGGSSDADDRAESKDAQSTQDVPTIIVELAQFIDSTSFSGTFEGEPDENEGTQADLAAYCEERYLHGVKDRAFEALHLPEGWIEEIQETWTALIEESGSRQAAGEAVWDAIMEVEPNIQKHFQIPPPVFATRFMNFTCSLVAACSDPETLKYKVEMLAFQHLEVTSRDRIDVIIHSISVAMDGQLGARFSSLSFQCFQVFWNYIGGALLYVQRQYGAKVRCITKSWELASTHVVMEDQAPAETPHPEDQEPEASEVSSNWKDDAPVPQRRKKKIQTPQSFYEMFMFNASVMGYAETDWMRCILDHMGAMARNAEKPPRLREESHVLALILSRQYTTRKHKLSLAPFKTVLLASFRSVMPEDWDARYEDAWHWFWDQIASILMGILGKLSRYRRNVRHFVNELSEHDLEAYRDNVFKKFFEIVPEAQDHFQVSSTRLLYIVEHILLTAMQIFDDPAIVVGEVSSMGLRHVGMNIPSWMFVPFAEVATECMQPFVDERRPVQMDALRWSLDLIGQIMARVSTEGSTLVMKAVSLNDVGALKKALAVTPRGKRMHDLLTVAVGSQSISPLYWSIDTGHLDCATAILQDLLTIRADRDVYYYGNNALFERHPDIIVKVCASAPSILWPLLDGLIWRSRVVRHNLRPANYYIQNLIQDQSGSFSGNIQCLAEHSDPEVIKHPALAKAVDLIWYRLVMARFIVFRLYFLFTLGVLVASQTSLRSSATREINITVAACRAFLYTGSFAPILCQHVLRICRDVSEEKFERTIVGPIPAYLLSLHGLNSTMLLLTFLAMMSLEPVIWCIEYGLDRGDPFTRSCPQAEPFSDWYGAASALALLAQWFLTLDLSIFSTRVSAFVLACKQLLSEAALTVGAICFTVLAFSTAINALDRQVPQVDGVQGWTLTLLQLALDILPETTWQNLQSDVVIQIMVGAFGSLIFVFILNLLVAQMAESYGRVFVSLQGCARLSRASMVATMAGSIPRRRWSAFLLSLHLEEPLEFNEGDIGPAGGVRVLEPATAHQVLEDPILRFGGSTAPESPWPEPDEDQDRFDRLEKMLLKIRQMERKRLGHSSSSGGSSFQSPAR